ncbi:hypothetical protein N9570_04025 [Candidatus Pelagibacter sp.]|nr:hypothetical protein [Candidatus Pelagibacter sp.]
MQKFYLLIVTIIFLFSCAPINDTLEIEVIKIGKEIKIDTKTFQNEEVKSKAKGSVAKLKKEIDQKDYNNRAKVYCSGFNKKRSNPVIFRGYLYYKCVEIK